MRINFNTPLVMSLLMYHDHVIASEFLWRSMFISTHIWFHVHECKCIYLKTGTVSYIILHWATLWHFNHQLRVVIPRFKFDLSQCCDSKIIP